MTQAAKVQEPSMEEILASIRRIIADDDAKPAAAAQPAPPAPEPPPPPTPPPRQAAPIPPPPPPPAAPVAARAEPVQSLEQDSIDDILQDDGRVEPTTLASEPVDVIDLTESMVAPTPPVAAPAAASFQTIDGEPDVVFRDVEPAPELTKAAPEPPRPIPEPAFERPLLSGVTRAAVDSAFNSLAHTVLVQNARTLEDLVREMLRPLLKGWLDDNLPGIVERLVRAEIERVSRGRN
jgi:cell pole-organizing protein PopZ